MAMDGRERQAVVNAARCAMPFISVETNNLRFIFDKNDRCISDAMMLSDSIWSGTEMRFCLDWLSKEGHQGPEGGWIFDIGANVGTTSLFFRQALGRKYRFIAFEPLPDTYRILKANCVLNGFYDIICEELALSNRRREATFYLNDGNTGASSMNREWAANSQKGYKCQLITLDEYMSLLNILPQELAFLWVDVEGYEPQFIEGAMETLWKTSAPLYMEFNPWFYKEQGNYDSFIANLVQVYDSIVRFSGTDGTVFRFVESPIQDLPGLMREMELSGIRQYDLLLAKKAAKHVGR